MLSSVFIHKIGGVCRIYKYAGRSPYFIAKREVNVESFYRMEEVIIAILQEIAEA